jgi:hypothetical protein
MRQTKLPCPICNRKVEARLRLRGTGYNSSLFACNWARKPDRAYYVCTNHLCPVCGRKSNSIIEGDIHTALRLRCIEHESYVDFNGIFLARADNILPLNKAKRKFNNGGADDIIRSDVFDEIGALSPEDILGRGENGAIARGAYIKPQKFHGPVEPISRDPDHLDRMSKYRGRLKIVRKLVRRFSKKETADPEELIDPHIPSIFDENFWSK